MKILLSIFIGIFLLLTNQKRPELHITRQQSVDSLGACQGAHYYNGRLFLYGDRDIGIIREFHIAGDSVEYTNREYRLTIKGKDIINHPTGIARADGLPTFIGNSVRLNKEGTQWKALIYYVDWEGLLQTGTLDNNLINTIEDDACIQGTRPEYVKLGNKWYVATADYGNRGNEVRLYDPAALAKAKNTSEAGVLYKKFTCSPWVQTLHWVPEKGVLMLIQNQVEGRRWRFTFLDLEKSVAAGKQQIISEIDIDRNDELEGFTFTGAPTQGVGVSSSRRNNVNRVAVTW